MARPSTGERPEPPQPHPDHPHIPPTQEDMRNQEARINMLHEKLVRAQLPAASTREARRLSAGAS